MSTGTLIPGLFGLWLGMLAEVQGFLYSNSASTQSFCFWSGVILLVAGLTTVVIGETRKKGIKHSIVGGESNE